MQNREVGGGVQRGDATTADRTKCLLELAAVRDEFGKNVPDG
jgi:hypothetical protein